MTFSPRNDYANKHNITNKKKKGKVGIFRAINYAPRHTRERQLCRLMGLALPIRYQGFELVTADALGVLFWSVGDLWAALWFFMIKGLTPTPIDLEVIVIKMPP